MQGRIYIVRNRPDLPELRAPPQEEVGGIYNISDTHERETDQETLAQFYSYTGYELPELFNMELAELQHKEDAKVQTEATLHLWTPQLGEDDSCADFGTISEYLLDPYR